MKKPVLLFVVVPVVALGLVLSAGCRPPSPPAQQAPVSTAPPAQEPAPSAPGSSPASEIVHYWPKTENAWDRVPSITVSAPAGDPRIQLARDAVDFWNEQLRQIGTPFRLGAVAHITDLVPADYLIRRSASVLEGTPAPAAPESLRRIPGGIVIAMSEGEFVSFSGMPPRAIIGIKSHLSSPLNLPNVAKNVIAHELGHVIGLGHNNDPTMLMVGRPSPHRPDVYRSSVERYFPLTGPEKAYLLKLYPPAWTPSR